jgi:hypothetical protein
MPYTGFYSRGIKVILEKGALNVLGYILIPMGRDSCMIVNGEEQVDFIRNNSRNIVKFVAAFRDGRRMPFLKEHELDPF